ncbi:unnamed protein product [Owenia fusiformis]|uniref:MAM domain-containing protein n=1 Tax=Owenia fusiformis TaxID=6347 RepID=A0A8S4NXY9_OWEFU|nr:unnamed protein product [Owenia fusiformis]
MNTHGVTLLIFSFLYVFLYVHVKAAPPFDCDFEKGLCGWQGDKRGNFQWTRGRGSNKPYNTGPTVDHTLGTSDGYYMYIRAIQQKRGHKARLISPDVDASKSQQCVSFWYHMNGKDIDRLNVFVTRSQRILKLGTRPKWQKKRNQGTKWLFATMDIPKQATKLKVVFEGVVGKGQRGDISIDDVTIQPTSCQNSKYSNIQLHNPAMMMNYHFGKLNYVNKKSCSF